MRRLQYSMRRGSATRRLGIPHWNRVVSLHSRRDYGSERPYDVSLVNPGEHTADHIAARP